jgi:ABC-type multidrug transport system fused ATPase/permease subunit
MPVDTLVSLSLANCRVLTFRAIDASPLLLVESLRGELTVVLIAHRLSTIRWADLIYVVEGGRVVESGDWSSLSNLRDGRFRALWEAQSLTI